jgi:CRP/FNR family cyclic AMP-dependent transcriptional regulator
MFEPVLAASASLPEVTVGDGVAVIVEGEPLQKLLVLVAGTVAISREGVDVSVNDQPGALFGELAALLRVPATATVRTVGECTFRVSDDPEGFLHARPEVALAVASLLARRLDALTRYLVDVRAQYSGRDDHLGVVDVVLESLAHHQGATPDPGSDRESEAPY